jgi:hypothetical protein
MCKFLDLSHSTEKKNDKGKIFEQTFLQREISLFTNKPMKIYLTQQANQNYNEITL